MRIKKFFTKVPDGEISVDGFKIHYFSDLSKLPKKIALCGIPFAIEIPNGIVCENILMDSKGRKFSFMDELVYYGLELSRETNSLRKKKKFSKKLVKHISGTVYTTFCACISYGHWMHDFLPVAELVKKIAKNKDYKFRILTNEKVISKRSVIKRNQHNYFKDYTLKLAGISKENILNYEDYRYISADKLVFIYNGLRSDKWVKEFIKKIYDKCIPEKVIPTEKIYISRRDTSKRGKMTNEKEIEEFLLKKGFKIYQLNDKTFEEQVRIFKNAKLIVAQHGSAMMNTYACRQGTPVIQIWPRINEFIEIGKIFNPCYPDWINLRHIICKGEKNKYRTFSVDLKELESELNLIEEKNE